MLSCLSPSTVFPHSPPTPIVLFIVYALSFVCANTVSIPCSAPWSLIRSLHLGHTDLVKGDCTGILHLKLNLKFFRPASGLFFLTITTSLILSWLLLFLSQKDMPLPGSRKDISWHCWKGWRMMNDNDRTTLSAFVLCCVWAASYVSRDLRGFSAR